MSSLNGKNFKVRCEYHLVKAETISISELCIFVFFFVTVFYPFIKTIESSCYVFLSVGDKRLECFSMFSSSTYSLTLLSNLSEFINSQLIEIKYIC